MFSLDDFSAKPAHGLQALVQKGDTALSTPWPNITATDYLDFCRNGLRIPLENKYFGRRHLLNDLVMAECAKQDGTYIDAIANAVWAICEESGWQLPPHNSYGRGGPNFPLPNPQRPVLDLFSCETGAQLALVMHLLSPKLEESAPGITQRVFDELKHRVITPYLTEHFWWMGNGTNIGDEQMCNWTPWCTQNVLIVAALSPQLLETCENISESRDICVALKSIKEQICEKAEFSLHCFLKDYGDDGCCDEGAKYYGHAALCLFASIEVLNILTDNQYMHWYSAESPLGAKIYNIADFIRQMHVSGDYYINFADCPPKLPPPNALIYLFGKRTANHKLAEFAAKGIIRYGLYKPSEDLSLYTRLVEFCTAEEISKIVAPNAESTDANKNSESKKSGDENYEDRYFASAGVFIARDRRTCLAVKAGHNADNHNHNDTGSVTLYFDGKPFLIDVGVGSYTRDTFSSRRYTIWTMQSGSHNLPTFNGVMQNPGAKFHATEIKHNFEKSHAEISMDIAAAYPPEAEVKHYRRNVKLLKNQAVCITDEYGGTYPAELSLMLDSKAVVEGNCISIEGRGKIYITGADCIAVEEIAVTDPLLQKHWGEKLYKGIVTFSEKITMEIS